MNLTNGNPLGCSQVATCGGLNSLSSLLIANYPWPRVLAASSGASPARESEGEDSEQDLDLLVTVLGVLCNLVEKDISNRWDFRSTTSSLFCGGSVQKCDLVVYVALLFVSVDDRFQSPLRIVLVFFS